MTSLTVLNQCRQPDHPHHIPISQTPHCTQMVLCSLHNHCIHWTQSRCSRRSVLLEHFSPSPWTRCASPWKPWVSSVFREASRSSSRPGPGPSCTVNTAGTDKRLHEGNGSCYYIELTNWGDGAIIFTSEIKKSHIKYGILKVFFAWLAPLPVLPRKMKPTNFSLSWFFLKHQQVNIFTFPEKYVFIYKMDWYRSLYPHEDETMAQTNPTSKN